MKEHKKKYLRVIKKRRDYLAERVADNPNLTYDLAEMSALTWAIETLSSLYNLDELFNERD